MKYTPKPLFLERMQELLGSKPDLDKYLKIIETKPIKSIRCNTLKISPSELIEKLKNKIKILQPYKNHPEIMQIDSNLEPGQLGKTKEHLLGYYYIQEITSMMPIIALAPEENSIMLDLCASPGSKTSQAGAKMNNKGIIIANDVIVPRIAILSANLEKTGITNTIITRHEGLNLCKKLNEINFKFDKILVDAPCTGEGNIRYSPKTILMWNLNMIKKMQRIQTNLLTAAIKLLKPLGEIVYSTCTHAPEENELVVNEVLKQFPNLEIVPINIPVKTRNGIIAWQNQKLNNQLKHAVRIYPHDENLEGFFLCKMRLKER